MARNLIKKGHPLIVYDVVSESVEALKADGRFCCQCSVG